MPLAMDIFGAQKALVGMVHVGALPGTPNNTEPVNVLAGQAVEEAWTLVQAGFDAVMIENMHDVPYLMRDVGPEIVASMTVIGDAVRQAVDVPLGVQILAGANQAALAVAQAINAQFIRAEGFLFASVADEGILASADAGPLLRYRAAIGATDIKILCDIKKKHTAHAITADVPIAEFARTAEFFGADGVIVTGVSTGRPASLADIRAVRQATGLPVVVGSGATPDNIRECFEYADAVIVGSWFKKRGDWRNPPDPERVKDLIAAANRARL
ncbi:MAG: BtpA/SgcQ family protein [Phycisphaerales bacterium]|nr:BtpA/SgcQ family protein [Phycisphaerales bacterium]